LLKRFGYVIEGAPDGPTEEYLDGIIERRMLLSVLILIAIFGAPWLIARITGIDLTAAGIPASSVLLGCAIVLDTIRHARTWRALEGPANGAGDPVEDSDPEGRPAGLEEQHAPGSEEPPDSGMEPEAAARVDVLEADTELEARLALATLEGHGIHGVMLCNRVIPLTGTLAFWEWTVPTYPFLVIHRRLGGGRVVVSVAERDADRAREVLAAVVTVVAPDEPGELAAPGDATSGGGGAVRRA
jgi:hypothetical protein